MNYVAEKRNVPLHPEEVRALKTIIGNYLDYLERMIPFSTERDRLLPVLQGVYTRLQRLLVLGQKVEGQRLWLTQEEATAIDIALLTFIHLVHLIIKPSQQLEDTVNELEKMRWRIRSLLVPPLH
ncbi:MAG: hypothetical protein JO125_16570 [Chloroflexi bacterium]|nr:hypothetical protein [Chloroflexota bacterium]